MMNPAASPYLYMAAKQECVSLRLNFSKAFTHRLRKTMSEDDAKSAAGEMANCHPGTSVSNSSLGRLPSAIPARQRQKSNV